MFDDGTQEYSAKLLELIQQITLIKLRLIAKYGMSVKRYWNRRDNG